MSSGASECSTQTSPLLSFFQQQAQELLERPGLTSLISASHPRPGNGRCPNAMGCSKARLGPASNSSHVSPLCLLTCLLAHHILVAIAFSYLSYIKLLPHQAHLPKCCSHRLGRFLSFFTWLMHLHRHVPV